MKRLIPSMLTAAGLALGLLGVVLVPSALGWTLLLASLILDHLDGAAARALNASTRVGAELDWATDVCIASAVVWKVLPPICAGPASAALAIMQTAARINDVRFSGRTLACAACGLVGAIEAL